jgi:hypothetical protein
MIYRVHCPRLQSKNSKVLGYISLCAGKGTLQHFYEELVKSKIINPQNWHPVYNIQIIPVGIKSSITTGIHAYALYDPKGREILYIHPVQELKSNTYSTMYGPFTTTTNVVGNTFTISNDLFPNPWTTPWTIR